MLNKISFGIIALSSVLTLSACASDKENSHNTSGHHTEDSTETDHSAMDHTSDGEIPEGIHEATNPTFPAGSKAIIKDAHMEGMKNAEATIVGAYDTTVYTVSYTPATGGNPVKEHKWVIHEELEGAGEAPLKMGDQATILANHIQGMQGANATIDSANETTVYMVDYISTTGEKVLNHKWVTESELEATE